MDVAKLILTYKIINEFLYLSPSIMVLNSPSRFSRHFDPLNVNISFSRSSASLNSFAPSSHFGTPSHTLPNLVLQLPLSNFALHILLHLLSFTVHYMSHNFLHMCKNICLALDLFVCLLLLILALV